MIVTFWDITILSDIWETVAYIRYEVKIMTYRVAIVKVALRYTEAIMRYKLAHAWHCEDSLNSDKVAL